MKKALSSIEKLNSTFIIKEKGRTEQEEAVVLVKNGLYQGFTFVAENKDTIPISEYEQLIELKQDNSDTQRIVRRYLESTEGKV